MPHLCRTHASAFHAKFIAMLGFLLLLAACNMVPQNGAPSETVATLTTQGDDGLVLIDAASFATNVPRRTHTWTLQKDPASANGVAMQALPDITTTLNTQLETLSPRLDYRISFKKAGTYYVWVYGRAADKAPLNGDSLHVGLGGKVVTSSSRITNLPVTYGWANKTMASRVATLPISAPGTYTLNVWMREDGVRFGALALSPDARFSPVSSSLPSPSNSDIPTKPSAPSITPTRVAFSSSALRGSVGVNLHATYTDTSYYDLDRMLVYLRDLDIAWVRDGIKEFPQPEYTAFLKSVAASGIKVNLIVGDPQGRYGQFGAGEQARFVEALKTTYAGGFHQLEGPNEWDTTSGDPKVWSSQLRDFYREYRNAIRADPALNGIRFIGGSMAQAFNFPYYTDYNQEAATLHPYPGGEMPELGFLGGQIENARKSAGPNKPVIATELGYNNAIHTKSGNVGVPEDVAAHYLIRELIYNYASGIEQNYVYQLFDERPDDDWRTDIEATFGLVGIRGSEGHVYRDTWSLHRKPTYDALKRFQRYLRDSGTGGRAAVLPFEIRDLPENALVYPVAREDGTYDIAVWSKNELWSTRSRSPIGDTTNTLTLRFASSVSVSSFRPSVSDVVTQVASGVTELNVPIDGKVTFFRVRPN